MSSNIIHLKIKVMGRLNYHLHASIYMRGMSYAKYYNVDSSLAEDDIFEPISFLASIDAQPISKPSDFEIELWSITPFIKIYWGGEFPDKEFDIKRVTKSMWKKASHYYRKYQWEQRKQRIEENVDKLHENIYHFDEDEFGY